ncbi:tRNA pseudouridine(38-40) synthase TruA [Massilia sp. H6]|uniref:tRNA pseudouridine(38-40) synthase TruA n=1 Tax=Massilia sp. H6 TaxID=2970464 RepID=UPI002167A37E|nr:tRNA pseudouridine(38-40) synthase TruA [Massilia sp. H6]UVW27743.1 tRNA pseudouridine(38-40) synthase TruA [Massilia sp. H6]
MRRIALGVQYVGTTWSGYQKQPDRNTVQDRLEIALEKFACTPLATTCAGRTDAGVHGIEQVVHFDTELDRATQSWVRGVNTFLPDSIAVRWAHETQPELDGLEFHARFSARSRTYHYVLYNHPTPSALLAKRAGWVFRPLDLDAMRNAARHLVGEHDFSAFRAASCQANTPVKQMHELSIQRYGDVIVFTVRASAFLHHMVRNIVGSLVYVGIGRQPPGWMGEVLASRSRDVAAPTFMPDGLYLAKIDYDPRWQLPQEAASPLPWL